MGIVLLKRREQPQIEGILRAYDRPAGSRIWRPAGEWSNIVVNAFYNDLFSAMSGGAPALNVLACAVGVGVSPTFARADVGLKNEWINPVALLSTAIANGATGQTTLLCAAGCPAAIPNSTNILIGSQALVANPGEAAGATSIRVNSFTSAALYPIGTGINVSDWTPQRMPTSLTTAAPADPPAMTWSFYLAAAVNAATVTFTEAGMLYNSPSLVAGGAGTFATHVAFAYAKLVNTDLRLDYTLQRTLT